MSAVDIERGARRSAERIGASTGRAAGQASVEYLVVVALLSIALMVGEDSPLDRLMAAIGEQYQRFSYAISRP
ncbi:MAG: hypothetical protein QM674_17960 [Burkholderiaceae bacterium]